MGGRDVAAGRCKREVVVRADVLGGGGLLHGKGRRDSRDVPDKNLPVFIEQ